MAQLDGRVAFISGGARGQGRSHAVALAREGCDIAVFDITSSLPAVPYPLATSDDLAETVKRVEAVGRRCISIVGDVRSSADVDGAVAETVERLGGLHIVVTNAGVIEYSTVETCTDEAWETVLGTNLTGEFKVLRAAIPRLKAQGFGRIITVASMAARQAYPNLPHYVAAKWGVVGLTKALAQELGGTGITVNTICPASLNSDMFVNDATVRLFFPNEPAATVADLRARQPATLTGVSMLEPEHTSRAVVYLATDPGVLTGQVMEIGNGSSAYLT